MKKQVFLYFSEVPPNFFLRSKIKVLLNSELILMNTELFLALRIFLVRNNTDAQARYLLLECKIKESRKAEAIKGNNIVFPTFTCRPPPSWVNDLYCSILMADTTYNITSAPYICHRIASLNEGFHRILFLAIQLIRHTAIVSHSSDIESCIFICRCATYARTLRNGKVYVAQGTRCCCAAVNRFGSFGF